MFRHSNLYIDSFKLACGSSHGFSPAGGDDDMPIVGEVRLFAMSSLPAKWLALGQDVSRSTYSALFSALGTVWGTGNGTTTFGLPPKGYAPVPAGAQSGLTTRALGATFGAETVTLTGAQSGVKAHDHGMSNNGFVGDGTVTITDPGHLHGPLNTGTFIRSEGGTDGGIAGGYGTTATTASAATGITAQLANLEVGWNGNTDSADAQDASQAHTNLGPRAAYTFGIYSGV